MAFPRRLALAWFLAATLGAAASSIGTAADKKPADDSFLKGVLPRLGSGRLRHFQAQATFSADGKELISVGGDGTIRRWDAATGRQLRHVRLQDLPNGPLAALLSHDGKTVIARVEKALRVYDAASGAERLRIPFDPLFPMARLAMSADGKTLAAQSTTVAPRGPLSVLQVWDAATGKQRMRKTIDGPRILAMTLSPDGTQAAALTNNKTLHLWNTETGKEIHRIPDALKPVNIIVPLQFSADGRRIATAYKSAEIASWDVKSGKKLRMLQATPPQEDEFVYSLALSADGKLLAAGTEARLLIWDVDSGKQLHALRTRVTNLAFATDGKTLVSVFGSALHLWDVARGCEKARQPDHETSVRSLAVSLDGKFVASLSAKPDSVLHLWDAHTGRQLARSSEPCTSLTCAWSVDSRLYYCGRLGKVCFHVPPGGNEIRPFALEPIKEKDDIPDVMATALSSDSTTLTALSWDWDAVYWLDVWDVAAGKRRVRRSLPAHGTQRAAAQGRFNQFFHLSPDGGTLLVNAPEGAFLEEMLSGHKLFPIPDSVLPPFAFSADGKRLVSVGADFQIKLWELSTGKLVRPFKMSKKMLPPCVAYSPDGRHVASGDARGSVILWDTTTGKTAHVFEGHSNQITVVAFAPDGKTLASSSFDGTARVWDVAGKRPGHVLRGHSSKVWSAAFSGDGRTVATGGNDGLVKLWDATNGRERATLRGHTGSVQMVAISADGRKLASGGQDRTVKVWDTATGKVERTLEGHPGLVGALAFAPSGLLLAAGCERNDGRDKEIFGEVHLWDAATGKRRHVLTGHRGYANAVIFAPDGRTLASVAMDGLIRFWDVESGRERSAVPGHAQTVRGLAWSPDGQTLVSAGDDQPVRLWDATGGPTAIKPRVALRGHYNTVTAVAIARVGGTLATGDSKGQIRIWDLSSGKLRYFLHRDSNRIASLDFAPDGNTLASLGDEGARLWDITEPPHSGKERQILWEKDIVEIFNVSFSPDGKTMASAGGDAEVRLWNWARGVSEVIPKPPEPTGRPTLWVTRPPDSDEMTGNPVAFAPDSRLLAVGRLNGTIQLLDRTTKTERTDLRAHERAVAGVAFTPDGKTLISGSTDGTIKLWEVLTGKPRATLEGHSGPVTCLALRSDGRTLASGSKDTTILLWDLTAPPAGRGLPDKPTAAQGENLWKELTGDDAARAYQTMGLLLRHPRPAIALLQEQLTSVKGPDIKRIDRLIADLDSDQFATREKAGQELTKFGALAEPKLRQARDNAPPLEVRRRLDALLEALTKQEVSPQQRLAARVTEVLERIATAEARQILQRLAGGSSGAWCAAEAKATLNRLDHRPPVRK